LKTPSGAAVSDIPQIREKYFMTAQGERLVTYVLVFAFAVFLSWSLVGCSERSSDNSRVPPEVQALTACTSQPALSVKAFYGSADKPGDLRSETPYESDARDRYLVDAVARCRSEVLAYYSGQRTAAIGSAPDGRPTPVLSAPEKKVP
jgi:hypothetical protein